MAPHRADMPKSSGPSAKDNVLTTRSGRAFSSVMCTCHKSKQAQSDDDEPDDSNDEDQPRIENAHNPSSAAKCPRMVQSDDKQADLDIDKEPHKHKDNGDESHRITKTDAIIEHPSSKSNSKRRCESR
ncbi:hypothetical protein BU15DRAFT_76434 [Melanogaster broomeanus]|nr:hypothetical protein BU15DRAFT_76434 [Melanogaster broomeanus]